MDVKEAINKRRAYRSLDPAPITPELIKDLAECASLSASCNNNQPWRFVFVYDPEMLKKMHGALTRGNEWIQLASMIIAVFSRKDWDCLIKEREYYLFDTGMAVAFIILRATELGLVAHPVAGYRENEVKEILGIPTDMRVITLINIGKHSEEIKPILTDKQKGVEKARPERLPFEKFVYMNKYQEG